MNDPIEFHPIIYTFRRLSVAEYDRLRESIRARGCLMPVYFWEHPKTKKKLVIDGRHRIQCCEELDKPYRIVVFQGTEEEAIALAESLNDDRRHRTEEERLERMERVLQARREGKSLRSIAEAEKVSKSQVERDLNSSGVPPPGTPDVSPCQTTNSSTNNDNVVVGKDGKTYPAKPTPKTTSILEGRYCERCLRIGSPVKDCEACKRLRSKTKKPRRKRSDAGKAAVDWRRINAAFSEMKRLVDGLYRGYGLVTKGGQIKEDLAHRGLMRTLDEWLSSFKERAKELAKEELPEP